MQADMRLLRLAPIHSISLTTSMAFFERIPVYGFLSSLFLGIVSIACAIIFSSFRTLLPWRWLLALAMSTSLNDVATPSFLFEVFVNAHRR